MQNEFLSLHPLLCAQVHVCACVPGCGVFMCMRVYACCAFMRVITCVKEIWIRCVLVMVYVWFHLESNPTETKNHEIHNQAARDVVQTICFEQHLLRLPFVVTHFIS